MNWKLLAALLVSINSLGQLPGLSIKKAKGVIHLDAELNETDWQGAEMAHSFQQYFPHDSSLARAQTEIRVTYDDHFIYVGAKMKNLGPRGYVTPSLRRDFRGEANDGVTVVFDTFKDRTNAFMFGVNPFGVQREGLIANGGSASTDLSLNWDNKWYSEAKIYDDFWIVEMAIPFKTIRFKEGLSSWNINFYRIDSEYAERSTWSPIPRNFDIITQAFSRELIWDKPLQKPGPNISLIPFAAARSNRDFETSQIAENEIDFGGDAKIAVSSALNLDLTINPDFSQVEVDEQVTNLDRFEIFFPERRQFFLENADLFANFGLDGTSPFFSRRIGVTRNVSTGQNIQNPIYAGARLSGKINNNLRVGLLNMQAGKDEALDLPSINYTVATLQHKVFSRSNVGFIAINKQAFVDAIGGNFTLSPLNNNRLLGTDFNLASKDNKWNGKAFYHRSFDDQKLDSAYAAGLTLNYRTLKWAVSILSRNVGNHYNPEVGFVRRKDIVQFASTTWYNFYPRSRWVQSHGPGFDHDLIFNQKKIVATDKIARSIGNFGVGVLDYDANLMYRIRWKSTALFNMRLRKEYTYLFSPFDPSGTGGLQLAAGSDYNNFLFVGEYISDARKKLYFEGGTRLGGYYNGSRFNLEGSVTYRYQPYGSLSINFAYNRIRLPLPYNNANLILVGPRLDFTFSRSVFWTTFVQYNSQINNLNINSRFQWRFKPVSDLFVVYTDNYFAEAFDGENLLWIGRPKLRALVVKLTYWLNL